MKRVFVTGATGFIGAAITRRLVSNGCEVAALVRPEGNLWRLGDVKDRVHLVPGCLKTSSTYEDALFAFMPDTVMHLGWHGVGKDTRNDPSQVRVNVSGSVDLFLAAQRAGCRKFLGAGSQAEYARSTKPLSEDSPTHPTTLYGAAKLATHVLLSHLAATYGITFAWLRLFSVYGPRDDGSTLVSYVISELLRGRRPAVSRGDQLWDYLYVDDAAAAFVRLGQLDAPGVYNVASGAARPLRETLLMIRDEINPGLRIGFGEAQADVHSHPLLASVDRLESVGWSPETPMHVGLRKTVAWRRLRDNDL